jgi:hypothetical protein
VDELADQLQVFFDDENIKSILEFWLLARCYTNLNEQKKADKIQKETIERIKIDSKSCSDPKDQKSNYSNALHQQIMAPLSPYKEQSKSPEKSSCQSCGFKHPAEFSFCPSCGARI